MRWFFFGGSKGTSLVSAGARDLVLWQGQKEEWQQAAAQTRHDENYVALGESYSRGGEVTGWLVQFLSGPGKVIKTVASSSVLEDLMRDPKKMDALVSHAKLRTDWDW